jgi:hypothetical protein
MSLVANPYGVLHGLQIVTVHLLLTLGLSKYVQLLDPALGILWYF